MSDRKQPRKKHKTIRVLENKANKGDINALFQLAEYYEQGQYVEKSAELAEAYLRKTLEIFQPQFLHVSSVKLFNFRVFEEIEMDHCDRDDSNLLVLNGNNGAGKTTLLDSISISLSWLIKRITTQGSNGNMIESLDINNDSATEYASIITELSITKNLSFDIELSKSKDDSNSSRKNNLQSISRLADLYKLANSNNDQFNFPIMAYYTVERANDINRKDISTIDEIAVQKNWSKFDGYTKALNGTADFKLFFRWFKYLEDLNNETNVQNQELLANIDKLRGELNGELFKGMLQKAKKVDELNAFLTSFKTETKNEIKELELKMQESQHELSNKLINTVTEAIYAFMPDFSNLRIQRSPSLDMLIDKKDVTLSVLQLSQGEKSLLALIADIARRLVLLNPSLDNALMGNGVVLIDEIDLHLHPEWQQSVLPNLTNTFPNIQFIVTTHSPQVLSTVKRESIRNLGQDVYGKLSVEIPIAQSYGMPSNDVLQSIMLVDPQPPIKEKINLYRLTELVDQGQYETKEALQLFKEIEMSLKSDHPQLLRLKRSIKRQKALKG